MLTHYKLSLTTHEQALGKTTTSFRDHNNGASMLLSH